MSPLIIWRQKSQLQMEGYALVIIIRIINEIR